MADGSIQLGTGGSFLFVGNSFTFGRVDPVMSYNTGNVRDLTAPTQGGTFTNTTGSNPYEPHPWGGVPGLFEAFASQAGLELDIAISARNAATLQGQYLNSNPAGWDLRGNVASQAWDVVVLQDNSTQPLPTGSGSITFAANSSTATLIINPTADTKVETDETIGIQVIGNSSYQTSVGVVTGTILNDDPTGPAVNPALPTVTLVASPGAVLEDGTPNLVYTFTRTGPTTSALTVQFGAARGPGSQPSVAAGGDFVNSTPFATSFVDNNGQVAVGSTISFTTGTGSVVIPAGATSVNFTLDPRADNTVETDEFIRLTLTANAAAYNVGTQGPVFATILNDDFTSVSLPNISLSLAASAVYEDGSGNLVYEFARTGSNAAPLTVNFSVTGTGTLPGGDFTVTGANGFSTAGAADPNRPSFETYAVKLAQYATTGAADGAIPANTHANAATDVYLYETWARPNMVAGARVATTDDTTGVVTTTTTTAPEYYLSLADMTADLRAAYEGLAATNPIFAGVAPVGAAFLAAVANGTAMADPYTPDASKVDLWWDDNLHASKYGSYLSGLTLFGTLTGLDPRSLGAAEHVAADLGITQAVAAALQGVAAATLEFSLDAHWTAPGQVTELQGGVAGLLATEGSFGFSDSDAADTHTITVTALTPGSVGTFTAAVHTDTTGDGTGGAINWHFTVDNTAVAFLAPGASRVEHFLVTISDANGGSAQRDIAVTINGSYNDAPAIGGDKAITVAEGSAVAITTADLTAIDPDSTNAQLAFTVTATSHGSVQVSGATVTSFTRADILAGTVTFLHDGGELDGSFSVSLSDGAASGGNATVSATVDPRGNDAPAIGGDKAITVAEGDAIAITTTDLTATDVDNTNAQLAFTVTATSHGSVQVSGATVTSFTQVDILAGTVTFLHDGGELDGSFSVSLSDGAASGGNATVVATVNPHVNDAPIVGGITLPSIVVNSGAHTITEAQLLANSSDADGDSLHAKNLQIESGLGLLVDNGNSTWSYTPKINDDTNVTFAFQVSDGQLSPTGHAKLDITSVQSAPAIGSPGNDSFTAVTGNSQFDGGLGTDTITFGFKLTDAVVTFAGNKVTIDGPSSHTVLIGLEVFNFTDGTVNNNDSDRLVNDLFYYSQNHDVWNAHADADTHYHAFGWHEDRDPNAFFSTKFVEAIYHPNGDPLLQYELFGWKTGEVPSLNFDPAAYLKANPDVAAAHVDPLQHLLAAGYQEGRQPAAPTKLIAPNGFDYIYYLQHNPDVAATGVDPLQHFETVGWKEGRNPNALFDTNGYLATYADVKAAGVNPLDHYDTAGWKEGRDPSVNFDTKHYLAAYADVAAAHIDPLVHYLQFGQSEQRSAFADGHFG